MDHTDAFRLWTPDRRDFALPTAPIEQGVPPLHPDHGVPPVDPDEEPCPIDPREARRRPHPPCPTLRGSDAAPARRRRRSRGEGGSTMSNKRKRTKFVVARLSPDEHAAITALADKRGMSPGALIRQTLLNVPPGPNIRRPSIDTKLLAKTLAELGKIGSNVNQIAYRYNVSDRPARRHRGRPRCRPSRTAGMAHRPDAVPGL